MSAKSGRVCTRLRGLQLTLSACVSCPCTGTRSGQTLKVALPAEYNTFKLLLTTFAKDGVFMPCIVPSRFLRALSDPRCDKLGTAQCAIFGKELVSTLSRQAAETPSLPVQVCASALPRPLLLVRISLAHSTAVC